VLRIVAYAWAGPNTLIGFAAGLLMLAGGAKVRAAQGAIEFSGGLFGRVLADRAPPIRFRAMTLGHVILGASAADLDAARDHEQVHVGQYERWGPFFLPAYLGSSAWQLLMGRRCYRDNYFERQAFGCHGDAALK
jgi:hypothetical protein